MRTQLFTNRVMTFMMPAMMLVMNAVSVLIVWVGGFSIDAGTIQTGDMIAFITYSMVIIMSFLMLGMVSIMLPRADVAAQRVNEVLAAPCSIADPVEPERLAGSRREGAEIVFDDVTFSYDEESDPVLSHVSFTAEAGKTTAVIGSTGSGKSTVIKLIERFYDVSSGSVRIDGVDVRDMTQRDLRAQFGYVPQKAFLFSGTIADTIGYSDPGWARSACARPQTLPRPPISSPNAKRGCSLPSHRAVRTYRAASVSVSRSLAPLRPMLARTCSTTASRRSITRPTPACAPPLPTACAARRSYRGSAYLDRSFGRPHRGARKRRRGGLRHP